jgi:hypothetical protein
MTQKKTCSIATLSTTNPKLTTPGANLCDETSVNNHPYDGTTYNLTVRMFQCFASAVNEGFKIVLHNASYTAIFKTDLEPHLHLTSSLCSM